MRWVVRALVVGAILAVGGCGSLEPEHGSHTPQASSPASTNSPSPESSVAELEGDWLLTSTIVESNLPEIYQLGFAEVRYPVFSGTGCDEDNCSGTIVLRSNAERQLDNDLSGEYLHTADAVTWTMADAIDCFFNKSVVEDGLDASRSFELAPDPAVDPRAESSEDPVGGSAGGLGSGTAGASWSGPAGGAGSGPGGGSRSGAAGASGSGPAGWLGSGPAGALGSRAADVLGTLAAQRFSGIATFDYAPTAEAISAGCDPEPAHVVYAVTLERR